MSYEIGCKIKELRISNKITQEDMASHLNTTRQRYSRLENGQVDISYVEIKKIADFFCVSTNEITQSNEEKTELVTYFREAETAEDVVSGVAVIQEILRVFHAHEKLYYQNKD